MRTIEIQKHLKRHGFNPGPLDGIMGPQTEAAIVAFKQSRSLRARPFVGPLTRAALRKGIKPTPLEKAPLGHYDMVPWLRLALGYLGEKEIKGPTHNRHVVSWWEALQLPFRDDETPWCAGFMNRMVQMAGLPIPNKYRAAALGWRWTGHGTRLSGPAVGAVFTITRPGRPGSGHTGFVVGRDRDGNVMILGGNQGNAVSINPYHPTDRDAQYHWPDGYPLPDNTGMEWLPIVRSNGKRLQNEA